MIKLNQLLDLAKDGAEIDLNECQTLFTQSNGEISGAILQQGDRYFWVQNKGAESHIVEVAIDWKISPDNIRYAFTPDGLHIYQIESRCPFRIGQILKLKENQIAPNMKCNYNGTEIEYVDSETLRIQGKDIKVVSDSQYTYKLLKTKIRAADGASGLFRFLENIAETGKYEAPLFGGAFDAIARHYA